MDFGKLAEALPHFLSRTYLFFFAVVAAFFLFASKDILEPWGVMPYVDQYRPLIAVVFIASIALFLVKLLVPVIELISDIVLDGLEIRRNREYLHTLTNDEKDILGQFINEDRRTLDLPTNSAAVTGLQDQGIIYLPQQHRLVHPRNPIVTYRIQGWAWDYLKKHPELILPADISD